MFFSSQRRLTSLIAASAIALGSLAACSNVEPPSEDTTAAGDGDTCAPEIAELEFGIISTESADNLKPAWEPLLAEMTEAVGRPVVGFYATDYAGVIEAMGANKVQIAWYGGKSYIEAAARSEAEAFAQTVALDGSKGYYSHLITQKDNPIVSEIDLDAGDGDKYIVANASELTFAFNDPNSTSGFLVPTYYVFAQQGANAEQIFDELIYAGSHEANALAVANGQVDVATNNNENLARLEETDPEALENIQVIWTSPVIPSDPLAYRKDLPDCLKDSIKDFFFNLDDEAILEPLQWQGLDPAGDEDWNTIRELQIAKDILEVQNDENLSDEDKAAQVDELNAKLDALK